MTSAHILPTSSVLTPCVYKHVFKNSFQIDYSDFQYNNASKTIHQYKENFMLLQQ